MNVQSNNIVRDLRRLRTEKEQMRRMRKLNKTFDDSTMEDKDFLKRVGKMRSCHWCHEPLKPHMINHRTGRILVSCKTDECPGNADLTKKQWGRQYKNTIGRQLDKKLVFDFKKIAYGSPISRLWSNNKGLF